MPVADFEDEFKKERRARLAAERLLEQKQSQLTAANRKLSQHAINLSGQIVDQRNLLNKIQGENSEATAQSLKANHKALAAERLLWHAMISIKDGFALYDKDRKLIAANAPYLDLFKASSNVGPGVSMESILELCIEDNLVARDGKSDDDWYDHMLDRLEQEKIEPITLKLTSGIFVKLVDRRTTDGGIVSLASNITDTIQREEELRAARDKAQAADRAKSTFLAKMSHEFRTPINGIVGMADLMLEKATDEDDLVNATTIKGSGEALLGFVDNVLQYAQIEGDHISLDPKPFHLAEMLATVKSSVPVHDIAKDVEVVFETSTSLPDQVTADGRRIRQIVENLYSNAIKNTTEGYVMTRMHLDHNTSGPSLVVSVEDTGRGISAEKQDVIFDGFAQADDSYARAQDGAGLGLSIARKLVDAMKGTLTITSVEHRGSIFEVSIPVSGGATRDAPAPRRTAAVLALDPLTQASITRALEMSGLSCETVDDIAAAAQLNPVAIFADQNLTSTSDSPLRLIGLGGNDGLCGPFRSEDILDRLQSAEGPDPKKTPIKTIRVLAAEDNKTNQLVFRKMLKDLDIDLLMVADGLEAVDAFKTFDPHVIFMDISMPKMDGMEATQQIRWHEVETGLEPVSIVAMTAHAMEGDEARIRNCGLDHYLTKPLKKAEIVARVVETAAEFGVARVEREAS